MTSTGFRRVCVFLGSSLGDMPAYAVAAQNVGRELARRGIGLVYGGGRVGLMGAVADAALAEGGEVIGVIPQSLSKKELGHTGLTELRVVDSMHTRKATMADLSDAFVALPGGFGTFEEFCEVLTWSQLGLHRKPCGLFDVEGYYRPLLALFDHATKSAFVRPDHRAMVHADSDFSTLLDRMQTTPLPLVEKWIDKPST